MPSLYLQLSHLLNPSSKIQLLREEQIVWPWTYQEEAKSTKNKKEKPIYTFQIIPICNKTDKKLTFKTIILQLQPKNKNNNQDQFKKVNQNPITIPIKKQPDQIQ